MKHLTIKPVSAAMATALVFAMFCTVGPLAAHEADPLNKDGCHEDKRHDKYHCHAGVLDGRSFDNAEQAAKAIIQEAIRPKNQSSEGQPPDPDQDPS